MTGLKVFSASQCLRREIVGAIDFPLCPSVPPVV